MGSAGNAEENVVEVSDLEFAYGGQAPFISKFSLKLRKGSRCLLIGANGAGMFYISEPLPLAFDFS